MSINAQAYLKALYPPPLVEPQEPPHLSDEDIAHDLDRTARRSKAARKAQETLRQKRAVQAASQEVRA